MLALSLRGLAKTYKNGTQALKGIDLDVGEGDFFALLGPNGAGKTTTIGIVTSLVTKSAGSVRVFGIDADGDLEAAKACIGLVPQELNFNMFEAPETIVTNQAGLDGPPRRLAHGREGLLEDVVDVRAAREAVADVHGALADLLVGELLHLGLERVDALHPLDALLHPAPLAEAKDLVDHLSAHAGKSERPLIRGTRVPTARGPTRCGRSSATRCAG